MRRLHQWPAGLKLSFFLMSVAVAAAGAGLLGQSPVQNPPNAALQRDPLTPAPARKAGEGLGPFKTMVVRGAMLIDGTGGPPRGPVDIIVSDNRIASIRNAGTPGMPPRAN